MRCMPRRAFLPPPSAVVDGPTAAVVPVAEVAAADDATATATVLAAAVPAVGVCG